MHKNFNLSLKRIYQDMLVFRCKNWVYLEEDIQEFILIDTILISKFAVGKLTYKEFVEARFELIGEALR